MMKYSGVPYFLYVLAKGIDDFSFIDPTERDKILKCTKVSFTDSDYKEIQQLMEQSAEFNSTIWTGVHEGRNIEKKRLQELRDSDGIAGLMRVLERKGIDSSKFTYIGRVHGSIEFESAVHVLRSLENDTYVSQGSGTPNVLRLKQNERIEVIKEIDNLYGVVVSGALRGLLEMSLNIF